MAWLNETLVTIQSQESTKMGNTRATQQKGRQVPKDEAVDEII